MLKKFCACCGYIMEKCNDVLEVFTNILMVVVVGGVLGFLGFMVVYIVSGVFFTFFYDIEWLSIVRMVLCWIGAIITVVGVAYNELNTYNEYNMRRNDCE